ncbi:MAG: cation transporter [Calditrichaeota bacterium]|nr:cation transporter [Calditrichota bacterium]
MKNTSQKNKTRIGIRLGYMSVSINFLLFMLKLFLGFMSHSLAIISDAFHTLSDILTSFLVIISFKVSAKPSDPEHPFGHGRAEQITSIVMATLLGVTAVELAKVGIGRILHPAPIAATWLIAGLMAITVIIKEWMARYTQKYSARLDSGTLNADAWHHHSDAITTILVIIAIILARYGISLFDGIVGILIGFYILYIAYKIVKKPIDQIMGEPTPPGLTGDIKNLAAGVPEIRNIHDIIFHNYGNIRLVSLHIEVDENMALSKAHQIAEVLTGKLQKELDLYATVHVDPMSKKTSLHYEIEKKVAKFCVADNLCHSFHELRIVHDKKAVAIHFDLQIKREVSDTTKDELKGQITKSLKEQFPQIEKVEITIDPLFALET